MALRRVWRLALTVTVVLLWALSGIAFAAGTFTDDDGNVHEGFIEAIAAEGITKGCNPPINDLYCPSDPVTRGQMAAFLVRALDLTDDGGGDHFTDDDDSVFEGDIDRLATAGVTKGCNPPANDLFCPTDHVTRGQMAAFLVRAFGYTDDGGGDLFVDDDDSVFEGDIDRLATAGVTKGCNPPTNDRYCPTDLVLRDQMASFLGRALGLTPITPPAPLGSRDNPVPLGAAYDLHDGWRLVVLSADLDADSTVIQACLDKYPWLTNEDCEDLYGPSPGGQYVTAQVKVTRTGEGGEIFSQDRLLTEDSGAQYVQSARCRDVLFDAYLPVEKVFKGGSIEGLVCWEVAETGLGSLLMLDWFFQADPQSPKTYFSLR